MVRQSEALSAWLSFLTPHVLGGVAVVVRGLVPFGVLEVRLAPDGQDGSRACAYGVCGLRRRGGGSGRLGVA
jgi:hypothetical protein